MHFVLAVVSLLALTSCDWSRSTQTHKTYSINGADYKKTTSCFIRKAQDETNVIRITNLTDPEEIRVEAINDRMLFWAAEFRPAEHGIDLTVTMPDIR